MSYKKIEKLDQLWNSFEKELKPLIDESSFNISEIQKLMTAESLIDLSKHAIYSHTEYVHRFTQQLLNLRNNHTNDARIINMCQLWIDLLKCRKQNPLKIQHHKLLDGTCSFNFSLRLMRDKNCGFKEVQILDPNDTFEFNNAISAIKHLGCLSHGTTFGDLPFMGDTVLSSLLSYKDTICFIAKDKNDHIIGYSWGIFLRDIPVGEKDKANVFWVMDLAKDPDFYDPQVKVGDQLRQHLAKTLNSNPDCHFLGYQHILNHKFHLAIVDGGLPGKQEKINLGQDQYNGKSKVKYAPLLHYMRIHIIRANNQQYPFPKYKFIESAMINAFWNAAHSVKDFVLGGMLFYGRHYYQQWTHSLVDEPVELRIEEPVSKEQQICDMNILKKLILSDEWGKQGTKLFFETCIPNTIQKLQKLITENNADFSDLQKCVANSGSALFRSKLTAYFYFSVTQNSNPTSIINTLISNQITPKKWIELISEERQMVLNQCSKSATQAFI